MHSFKVNVIISKEYSQPSILSTVLYIFLTVKFAVIKFCQRTFFKRISEHQSPWNKLLIEASTFPEQYRLYWNENSDFEAATFPQKDFFQIVVWSSYFLLITTSWWQILLLISYFFKINTFSAQLLSRRDFFFRISNYSEHVLFRNRYFFRTANFSEEVLFRISYFLKTITFRDSSA